MGLGFQGRTGFKGSWLKGFFWILDFGLLLFLGFGLEVLGLWVWDFGAKVSLGSGFRVWGHI